MYRTLSDKSISSESFVNIVHFLIGILIKYKNVSSSKIDVDKLVTAPSSSDLTIAHKFLREIDAENLIDNDAELDAHIQNLYLLLKRKMETTLNPSRRSGIELLKILRGS